MLKVLQHILMSRPAEHPEHADYTEAVKEFQTESMYELQRLASKMPDQLLVGSLLASIDLELMDYLGCLPSTGGKGYGDNLFWDT